MAEVARRRIDISAATFVRALLFVGLAWAWLRLWRWLLLFVVAAILAVALDPLVVWLDRKGFRRAFAAPVVVLTIVAVLVGFFYVSSASLTADARMLGGRVQETQAQIQSSIPDAIRDMLPKPGEGSGTQGNYLMVLGRAFVSGLLSVAIAFILTIYLLLDGRRTYTWLAAFAPPGKRERVHRTAAGARAAIIGYMRGNVATSVLAAIVTFIVLRILDVPGALLMGVLSGLLNFIPVVGIVLSLVPAVLLALTVSAATAAIVAGFYLAYNAVENYYIQPRVYGHEMRLSSLAVLAAFAVGAELAGVVGALIALPIAATYPAFENEWLKGRLDPQSVDDHRLIEKTEEH